MNELIKTNSVKIGEQEWMIENLNVDRFRNGVRETIPEAKTDKEWEKAGKEGTPAWCYYNNNPENGEKYGKLYNWYAVNDPNELAPKGWHISSNDEWDRLIDYFDGLDDATNKIKAIDGWNYNRNGNNESGFTAIPGGCRVYEVSFENNYCPFHDIGYYGYWWSSTKYFNISWCWFMGYNGIYKSEHHKKINGFSVRCIKDKR